MYQDTCEWQIFDITMQGLGHFLAARPARPGSGEDASKGTPPLPVEVRHTARVLSW